jgi:hypothetical protein
VPLPFLPGLAQEFYTVTTDAQLGGCVPALDDGGLLIDPPFVLARDAIKTAFWRASDDEATLFLAFIGHGEYAGTDLDLLPYDAPGQPDSDMADP